MAISAGMALMSTATGFLTGGAASLAFGSTLGFLGLGSIASHFLVTTAIGAAIHALSPKSSTQASGYNVTVTSSVADHQIIYGKTKAAGVRVFDASAGTNNKYLHRVIAFTGHEIEAFDEIYINDALVTSVDVNGNVVEVLLSDGTTSNRYNGYVRIKEHLGSTDQLADSDLVAEVGDWTTEHRLRGIAYLYVKFSFNGDVFPNGVPEITAVIKGKKVYDPRTGITAWSDNSALCLRDYLTNTTYGLKEDADSVDDDLFVVAANVCDYMDYPTLTGNQRYTANGSFTTATNPYTLLNNLLSSMGGLLWYAQGKWRVKPAYWTSPVTTLNEDDLRSSISISTRHSRRDNFNTVSGVWKSAETNWQTTDFTAVTNQDFIDADNGEEVSVDLSLPFTTDMDMARRIANVYLERNRQQLTIQASFGLSAFKVQVGDIINFSNKRFGWTEKEFEVVYWTFGLVGETDLQVQMTLREITETVFDDYSDGAVYERDNTNLLSPFDVPTVGISLSATLQIIKEKLTNIVSVNVTSGSVGLIDRVEVEYKPNSTTSWKSVGTGQLGLYEVVDTEDGLFDFRARAINTFGVKGSWTTLSGFEVNGLVQPPSNITTASGVVSGGNLFLDWEPVTDLDLSYYRIRHAVETSGATWGNSTTSIDKIARPASSVTLPARSGTFMIRPYDKSGITSGEYFSVVIQSNEIVPYTTTLTQTDSPSFSGTKTNCSVSGSDLIITDVSATTPEATYDFSTYIDTGSSRLVRARVDASVYRVNAGGNNFDSLVGYFDDLSGYFDDLSGDQDFSDTDLEFYISTTEDDPAGVPTWTDYRKFRVGDFYGRAFKFRVVLKSYSANITPAISALSAIVEYN